MTVRIEKQGKVWTVFQGRQPEPFAVEVTGVVRNALGPGKSLILCELTDERVQKMGAVAGMSGSVLLGVAVGVRLDCLGRLVGLAARRGRVAPALLAAHAHEVAEHVVVLRPVHQGDVAGVGAASRADHGPAQFTTVRV